MREMGATWRAWSSFRGSGAVTMAFLAARLAVYPLGSMDPELRGLSGRVLSLGCGHGIGERYTAEINDTVEIDGVELDAARVAMAARTESAAPRVRVRLADVTELVTGGTRYDAALAVDVLHHVPRDSHASIARALRGALRPGGVCLVKDIATRPAWQHRFNQVHDRLVTGDFSVDARAPEDMAAVFSTAGFVLEGSRRLGRITPYPHYLLTLRRSV